MGSAPFYDHTQRADVLHIGYPKAASTFVVRYLEGHPEVTVDEYHLSALIHNVEDDVQI